MLTAAGVPGMLLVAHHTRDFGIAAYAVAAVACLAAGLASRGRPGGRPRFWYVFAGLHAFLAVEVPLMLRFRLADLLRHLFRDLEPGRPNRPYQVVTLAVLGLLFLLALFLLWSRGRRREGRRLAGTGLLLSAFTWLVEAISLHQTAPVLYHHLGPAALVGWVWVLAGALVVAGAWEGARARSVEPA